MRLALLICCVIAFCPIDGFAQSGNSPQLRWRQQQLNYASAFGFSHSGKILAVVEYPQIKMWDLDADTFIRAIPIPARAYDQLAFSQDDKEIVLLKSDTRAYGWREQYTNPASSILRLDIQTGSYSIIALSSSHERNSWSLSPDGERVAMLSGDTLSVVNSRSNTVISSTVFPIAHRSWPNVAEASFVDSGKKIFVFWYGEGRLCETNSLDKQQILVDSISWRGPRPSVDGIFLPHIHSGQNGVMIDARSGAEAELQPLQLQLPLDERGRGRSRNEFSEVDDATLFGSGEYLAARYIIWRGMVYDYGTPPGDDSVVFTSLHDRSMHWSLLLSNEMKVVGQVPHHPSVLVFSDGRAMLCVDVITKRLNDLTKQVEQMVGFAANGSLLLEGGANLYALDSKTGALRWTQQNLGRGVMLSPDGESIAAFTEKHGTVLIDDDGSQLEDFGESPQRGYLAAYLDGPALLMKGDYTGPATLRTADHTTKPEPDLAPFLRYIPYGRDFVIAYSNYWSQGDSAVLYDYSTDEVLMAYCGGLNGGIEAAALSHDQQWLVTIARGGGGKLWRISDGALKKCFGLQGRHTPLDIQFTPNDRFLVYANDTALMSYDLSTDQTAIALPRMGESHFNFSRDGKSFAITNGLNGLSAYEVPLSWQQHFELQPRQNFLLLRWYLPASALEAMDTNGHPFTPPRTIAKVELRYADGKLLRMIVDGPFHKGKWHAWEVDMTEYPAGKYIMHTEIGGVMKDETLELK